MIVEGEADVTKDGQTINRLGAGDFFGEIALVTDTPRTATVTATSPVRALVITDRASSACSTSSRRSSARCCSRWPTRQPRPLVTRRAARRRSARERVDDPLAQRRRVLVRERALGRLEADGEARPTCGPRRPARRGRRRRPRSRAAPRRPPRAPRRRARRRATSSGTTNARSCRTAGYVITSSYAHPLAAPARGASRGRARRRPTRPRAAPGAARRRRPRSMRAALPGWSSVVARRARSAARP